MAASAENMEMRIVESKILTPEELRAILQAHFRAFVLKVGIENGKVIVTFPGKAPGNSPIF